jgi:RNA polymerase sigma-70 factor (ECF subfamily)
MAATDETVRTSAKSLAANGSSEQFVAANSDLESDLIEERRTTIVLQRYLGQLAESDENAPAEPIIRALIDRSASRLHLICRTLLARKYPRLARPPLNLQSEELLSTVVARLFRALRQIRPTTVRQFFALANRHMRWELNDLARHMDAQKAPMELRESLIAEPESDDSPITPNALRILDAIESLPDEEREVFSLVRIQDMTHAETARVLGTSTKTVQRRLNRALLNLADVLTDLNPTPLSC